jgi:nitrate/nitrite-specific signal transduction histidine kinase
MRERADSIGATISWRNPTSGGCRVTLDVAARSATLVAAGIV